MDSPMTTECDALREENEMLAAENRRLLNEVNGLRSIPPYNVDAAIRAVWFKGFRTPKTYHDGTAVTWEDQAEEVGRVFTEALRDA